MVRNPQDREDQTRTGREQVQGVQSPNSSEQGQSDGKNQEQGRDGERQGQNMHEWRERAMGGPAAQQLSDVASKVAGEIKDRSASMIDQQKSKLVEHLTHIGSALHKAGESLQEEQGQPVSDVAHGLADRVEKAAGFLKDRSLNNVADDLRHTLRRHPEVAMIGLFVGGLILARFLKASASSQYSGSFGTRVRGYDPEQARMDEDGGYQEYEAGLGSGTKGGHSPARSAAGIDPGTSENSQYPGTMPSSVPGTLGASDTPGMPDSTNLDGPPVNKPSTASGPENY